MKGTKIKVTTELVLNKELADRVVRILKNHWYWNGYHISSINTELYQDHETILTITAEKRK